MTSRSFFRLCASAIFVFLAVQGVCGQEGTPAAGPEVSQRKLEEARALYVSGEYEECRELVSQYLEEYESGDTRLLPRVTAAMYALDALLAYTFREEGFEQKIDRQLKKGLELDLGLDLGDPAEVPPFILNRFSRIRSAYLEQFSRVTRRHGIGLFGALVLEPTMLVNPLLLQPGIAYSFNLTENWSITADFRFPLQWPLWNSIRGQIGVVWYPTFSIEKLATGVSFAYTFGLDNLSAFTHSISFGGRAEYLTRMGIGIVGNAELVRANLMVGSTQAVTPPTFSQIPFLGLLQFVFANINIYIYYAF
jgi:hypothetical protein